MKITALVMRKPHCAIGGLVDSAPKVYPTLVSVIQAISTLRRGRKKRELHNAHSRGAKIKALEDSIANLDSHKVPLWWKTYEGVQRIRGLAGCGKTIVLALKSRIPARKTSELGSLV